MTASAFSGNRLPVVDDFAQPEGHLELNLSITPGACRLRTTLLSRRASVGTTETTILRRKIATQFDSGPIRGGVQAFRCTNLSERVAHLALTQHGSPLQGLIDSLAHYPLLAIAAVFAAALLEALAIIGTVFPGSTVVFAAGVLVGLSVINPWWAAAAAVSGAVLGNGISYWLGREYRDRLRGLWPMSSHPALLERGEAFFARHGGKSVFFAQFVGPVRAIVPMVAGMARMPTSRFAVINALSAIAWAAAHLLPGMLFGASLQLAGAVSARLAILMATAALAVWLIVVALRLMRRGTRPFFISARDRAVAWARKSGGVGSRITLSLLDPTRPESTGLLSAAFLLLGSGWLFFSILEGVVSKDALVRMDQIVFASLQHLRTPWVDRLMIMATELGSVRVAVPVVASVALLLIFKRRWRTVGYWLSAVAFAQALVWVLKLTLARARPIAIYDGAEQFSFPSGHAASSIVLYGFLAVVLARGKAPSVKWAAALFAVILVGLVSFSRLYLGAHWMSDVLGSLALGTAWVALLSMAYLQHARDEHVPAMPLAGVALGALLLAGGAAIATQYPKDLVRYAPQSPAAPVVLADWQATGWRQLPARRTEVDGDNEEPLTVQWAGAPDHITEVLQTGGWRRPSPWTLRTAASWLLPGTLIEQLPVLEKFHQGVPASLSFVDVLSPTQRVVLRLWPSGYTVANAGQAPSVLWQGMVTVERIRHPAHTFTLALTDPDFQAALTQLLASIQPQDLSKQLVRGDAGTVLLLR